MPRSIAPDDCKPNPQWLMPDALRDEIEPLLPARKQKGSETRGDAEQCSGRSPDPTTEQDLVPEKGFDYPHAYELVGGYEYSPHIRSRGEEKRDLAELPGCRARRRVVEGTHSWTNRLRRLLIRWEKK